MKKILSIVIIGILLFGSIGASAISIIRESPNKSSYMDNFDMVIITPQIFSDTLQPLINHKNTVGVHTFIKTTEEIYSKYQGRDNAEQIKYGSSI